MSTELENPVQETAVTPVSENNVPAQETVSLSDTLGTEGQPAEQNPEGQPAAPESAPAPDEQKKNHAERRWDKMIAARATAEAEVKFLREQLAKKEPQQNAQPVISDAPKADQFENYDDYVQALTDYKVDKRFAAMSQANQADSVQKTFLQKEVEFKAKTPDYNDAIAEVDDIQISRDAANEIMKSDLGPDVRYYLAKHPEELSRLSNADSATAARQIGRIEAKIEMGRSATPAKPAVKAPKAPAPLPTVAANSGASNTDIDKMSTADFVKYRNQERIKQGKLP